MGNPSTIATSTTPPIVDDFDTIWDEASLPLDEEKSRDNSTNSDNNEFYGWKPESLGSNSQQVQGQRRSAVAKIHLDRSHYPGYDSPTYPTSWSSASSDSILSSSYSSDHENPVSAVPKPLRKHTWPVCGWVESRSRSKRYLNENDSEDEDGRRDRDLRDKENQKNEMFTIRRKGAFKDSQTRTYERGTRLKRITPSNYNLPDGTSPAFSRRLESATKFDPYTSPLVSIEEENWPQSSLESNAPEKRGKSWSLPDWTESLCSTNCFAEPPLATVSVSPFQATSPLRIREPSSRDFPASGIDKSFLVKAAKESAQLFRYVDIGPQSKIQSSSEENSVVEPLLEPKMKTDPVQVPKSPRRSCFSSLSSLLPRTPPRKKTQVSTPTQRYNKGRPRWFQLKGKENFPKNLRSLSSCSAQPLHSISNALNSPSRSSLRSPGRVLKKITSRTANCSTRVVTAFLPKKNKNIFEDNFPFDESPQRVRRDSDHTGLSPLELDTRGPESKLAKNTRMNPSSQEKELFCSSDRKIRQAPSGHANKEEVPLEEDDFTSGSSFVDFETGRESLGNNSGHPGTYLQEEEIDVGSLVPTNTEKYTSNLSTRNSFGEKTKPNFFDQESMEWWKDKLSSGQSQDDSDWMAVVVTGWSPSNEVEIYCIHRTAMNSGRVQSTFFCDDFDSGRKDGIAYSLIELDRRVAPAFPAMLDYIYSDGESKPQLESFQDASIFHRLAHHFGVSELEREVSKFVENDMNKDNAHDYFCVAKELKDDDLLKKALHILAMPSHG